MKKIYLASKTSQNIVEDEIRRSVCVEGAVLPLVLTRVMEEIVVEVMWVIFGVTTVLLLVLTRVMKKLEVEVWVILGIMAVLLLVLTE